MDDGLTKATQTERSSLSGFHDTRLRASDCLLRFMREQRLEEKMRMTLNVLEKAWQFRFLCDLLQDAELNKDPLMCTARSSPDLATTRECMKE